MQDVEVVLGITTIDTFYWEPLQPHEVRRHVHRAVINPDWEYILGDLTSKRNNMALLQLLEPVEFSSYVRPICLATSLNEVKEYKNCMVAGWGDTGSDTGGRCMKKYIMDTFLWKHSLTKMFSDQKRVTGARS